MGTRGLGISGLSVTSQACKFALRMCGPNLECEELTAAFQKHLQEGRGLHFGEFLNATCKHLVRGRGRGRGREGHHLRHWSPCGGLPPSCRCVTSRTCWAAW